MINTLTNWIKANWYFVLLGTLGFIFFIPSPHKLIATIFITIVLEHLAMLLYKNIIVFVMNDNYFKTLFTGEDGMLSRNETLGFTIFQGLALVSAHLTVVGVALAIYFTV